MSGFEWNKIFAAILVAGIVAKLGGFIAEQLIHPHELETDAVAIEGVGTVASGGAAAPQLPEPILHLIATAQVEQGAKLSKVCATCHSFDKGGPVKQGPSLWNIVQHPKAAMAGFEYSEGMKTIGGNWDYLSLNKLLWKPKNFVPGTKMNFIGLKKPEERAAIIAWLRTLSDNAPPLPTDAEIAAEAAELTPPPAAEETPIEDGAPPADAPAEDETNSKTPAPAEKTEPTEKTEH